MQFTTIYLDSWSTLSSTMKSNIDYKENLFKRANLNPIRGKPTFETVHKIRNNIKANTKYVY